MDELPELPFRQVLSYLSLSGVFTQNFIDSTRFTTFFNIYGQTILSNLKHLRLCELDLSEGDRTVFASTLNSLGKLKQLDIIRSKCNEQRELKLNLPMLSSFQLEDVRGIQKLTLETPKLWEVKILDPCRTGLRVEIVHGESVERLFVDWLKSMEVKNLKNLQHLYVASLLDVDPTLLSSLQQMKEIHTSDPRYVLKVFEQKQRYGHADLKIYLGGLLLNGPDDPATNAFRNSSSEYLSGESLVCLTENPSRLADEIPFYSFLYFSDIERIASSLEVDLLRRFTRLNQIKALSPVQDFKRFLNLLKNFENIELRFNGDQPQDLFDRLPEHSAVQKLILYHPPCDLDFIFRLKHLIYLFVDWQIESETIRRAFEELPVLYSSLFRYGDERASIQIGQSKQFLVRARVDGKTKTVSDLNAAIEFLFGNEKKRKAEVLE